MSTFGHNLPTTNARWPVKGSKDADFRLVYFIRKNGYIATWNFFSVPDDVIMTTP